MKGILVTFSFLILAMLLARGCAELPPLAGQTATRQPAVPQATGPARPPEVRRTATPIEIKIVDAEIKADFQCPVSTPTQDYPTDTDVFGGGPGAEWYCSQDNELCTVKSGPWPAGGWKVGWRKPPGANLEVSGRRLDAEAPPLGASVPDGYGGTFQASGLIFPTGGCWEVEARAGSNVLRFVVPVDPLSHPPAGGRCDDLSAAVRSSDAIILGRVDDSNLNARGYAWQTVSVLQPWKKPSDPGYGLGDRIEVLQDIRQEPALEQGQLYLLFLQYEPWQIFCPERTLAKVSGQQVVSLSQDGWSMPLWSGGTLADVGEELVAALRD